MTHSKKRLLAILAALGVSVGGGLAAAPHVAAQCPPEPAECEEDTGEDEAGGEDTGEDEAGGEDTGEDEP